MIGKNYKNKKPKIGPFKTTLPYMFLASGKTPGIRKRPLKLGNRTVFVKNLKKLTYYSGKINNDSFN